MTHYHTYFPAALKIEDRRVVIVGGDDEATKKAREVLRCHARLTVISPAVTPELEQLANEGCLTLQRRPYADGDLAGAMLAIVCDRTMAPAIRAEAQQRGVLLNVLDWPELCDFIAPATFSRDGLQFAIHTSGRGAALARRIRERLETQYGAAYAEVARMLGDIRPVVREMIPSADARRSFWLDVVNAELLERIDGGLPPAELKEQILKRAAALGAQRTEAP